MSPTAGREPILLVSRSMPPDIGGYQRQFTLLAPHLAARAGTVAWIGAVRDAVTARPGPLPGVTRIVRLPAHRLPRRVRGLADPVVCAVAVVAVLALRATGRRARLLLLSPGMRGAGVLLRVARLCGATSIVRYPTEGDLAVPRARRAATLGGIPIAPAPAQVREGASVGVRLVPNAVEVPPSVAEADRGVRTFLYAGRLIARKRVGLLLEAWGRVAPDLPGWRLVLVGDGGSEPDSVEAEVRRLAADGPAGRTELVGRVDDARSWIAASDVFVFTSAREGLPNSVLEALAAGVPVIADSSCAGDWFLEVPPMLPWDGTVDDLARALRDAARDEPARRAVGDAGRAFVETRHAPDVAAETLVSLR